MTKREFLNVNNLELEYDKEQGLYFVVDAYGGIIGSGESKSSAVEDAMDNYNN